MLDTFTIHSQTDKYGFLFGFSFLSNTQKENYFYSQRHLTKFNVLYMLFSIYSKCWGLLFYFSLRKTAFILGICLCYIHAYSKASWKCTHSWIKNHAERVFFKSNNIYIHWSGLLFIVIFQPLPPYFSFDRCIGFCKSSCRTRGS